jgi:hypothetical protein
MGIVNCVGRIAKLGRERWGVGHGSGGVKRKCMTGGGVRLKDISTRGSGATGGGC